jgi:F-type H+-transporting ATPase subunit epsilon
MATANTVDPEFGAPASKADGSKPGHRIQCVVVTPERTLFDDFVEFVVLPLFDGELGVLPGRSPLIGRLGYGELRTRSGDTTRRYFVDGGFAQVRDNVVTVLTNRAIPSSMVDVQAAERELERALALKGSAEIDMADRTRAIDRARAQIRIVQHASKA